MRKPRRTAGRNGWVLGTLMAYKLILKFIWFRCIIPEVNAFIRKIATSVSTTIQLVRKGDEYTLTTKMLLLTTTQKFKLGEEKEVTTADGRKVKNVFTVDGNVLTEQQIGERTLTTIREFFDNEMIATSYYGNVVCKAYCKVLKWGILWDWETGVVEGKNWKI